VTLVSEVDVYLFNEGRHYRLHEHLGAHCVDGGVEFAVWAPNATSVSVMGDRNAWNPDVDPLAPVGSSGIWTRRLDGWGAGDRYKYRIATRDGRALTLTYTPAGPLAGSPE